MKTTLLAYILMIAGLGLVGVGAFRFVGNSRGGHPMIRRLHLSKGDIGLGLVLIALGQVLRLLLFIWAR